MNPDGGCVQYVEVVCPYRHPTPTPTPPHVRTHLIHTPHVTQLSPPHHLNFTHTIKLVIER